MLSFQVPASGTYYLQVRDTTYSGNPSWSYALHAVTGPVATSVFPLAVNPGTTAQLEVRGPGDDRPRSIDLPVPKDVKPGEHFFALSQPAAGTLPVPLVVTTLPVSAETGDAPAAGDPAQAAKLPVALCGRLGERGDADGYRFEARKGVIYAFEVVARRAGSECDPVLRVLDAKGSIVTEADDTRGLGKDARIEWKAPADGTLCAPGRPTCTTGEGRRSVTCSWPRRPVPTSRSTCDPDMINVGPGGRVPVFVRLDAAPRFCRRGQLGLGRPAGGRLGEPAHDRPAMTEGVIVVSAAPEAKHAAALVALEGTGQGPGGPIVRPATPQEEIYLPGGGRGHYPVETLALAVTDPSDITVEATPARDRPGAGRIRRARRDRDPQSPLRAGGQPGDRARNIWAASTAIRCRRA